MAIERTIPEGFPAGPLDEIDRRLAGIGEDGGVAIPLAIASGSRAWGFPSPDSDFDCRFIYDRRAAAYLTPWPPRDVIEFPIVDDIDLNGWDLSKAIALLIKGNAVVIEWLRSPIVYRDDPHFREDMLTLAERFADRHAVARHYLHLGLKQRRTYFADEEAVKLKKLFYALRPAAALRWMRTHPARDMPPMHFPTLLDECDPPADVGRIARDLIVQKAKTREMGAAPLPLVLCDFIDGEFEAAEAHFTRKKRVSDAARLAATKLFRATIERLDDDAAAAPR